MPIKLAQRLQQVQSSPTIQLDTQAKALLAAGQPVINLTVGELDFALPAAIQQAAKTAITSDTNHYSPTQGLAAVRQIIADYIQRRYQLTYPINQIIITNGAKQALFSAFQVLVNPGDEVLLPQPAWVSYVEQVKLVGGVTVPVPTTTDWQLDIEALRRAITGKTVGLVLNYPNNPTGAVYRAAQVEAVVQLAREHQLWIISDDIYEKILYDNNAFVPVARYYPEGTIIINGLSKSGAMTGWRVGYAAGPSEVIKAMNIVQSHLCGNVCNVAQLAAEAALLLDDTVWQDFMRQLSQRRQVISDWLSTQPKVSAQAPAGAFYFFIDIRALGTSAEEFCQRALQQHYVGLVPGDYFGNPGFVRLSFAHSLEQITQALERLGGCIASY